MATPPNWHAYVRDIVAVRSLATRRPCTNVQVRRTVTNHRPDLTRPSQGWYVTCMKTAEQELAFRAALSKHMADNSELVVAKVVRELAGKADMKTAQSYTNIVWTTLRAAGWVRVRACGTFPATWYRDRRAALARARAFSATPRGRTCRTAADNKIDAILDGLPEPPGRVHKRISRLTTPEAGPSLTVPPGLAGGAPIDAHEAWLAMAPVETRGEYSGAWVQHVTNALRAAGWARRRATIRGVRKWRWHPPTTCIEYIPPGRLRERAERDMA